MFNSAEKTAPSDSTSTPDSNDQNSVAQSDLQNDQFDDAYHGRQQHPTEDADVHVVLTKIAYTGACALSGASFAIYIFVYLPWHFCARNRRQCRPSDLPQDACVAWL